MRNYLMLGVIVGCLGAATPCFAADTPVFLDAASGGPQSASSLTIQKDFAATSTDRYLFYAVRVQQSFNVASVTWHNATMTHLLSMSNGFSGAIIRVYGLADPDVGASYDAVATMGNGGIVGDGLLLLYGGVSSTNPIVAGSSSFGAIALGATGDVTTRSAEALAVLLSYNGTDLAPTPGGDAVLRANAGGFAALERGPLSPAGEYAVSASFNNLAAHLELAFSIERAVPPPPLPQPTPVFIDSATGGPSASSTMVIAKDFAATSTNRFLFYVLHTQVEHDVQSVMWHNATMTHLLSMNQGINGNMIRVYGLANPDVGAPYDAVATMAGGGIVGDGLLLLYGGVSSTNPVTAGTTGYGVGASDTGYATTTSGASLVLISDNGTDVDPTPRGDGALRAATAGFAAIEGGLFMAPGLHSVSAMFGDADYFSVTFAIEPAVPSTDPVPPLPQLIDPVNVIQTETIRFSKRFEPMEDGILLFTFQTDAGHQPLSVTWHNVPMTQQSASTLAGVTTYVYGLEDPPISEVEGGEDYEAVAMVSQDGMVYSGSTSLYNPNLP